MKELQSYKSLKNAGLTKNVLQPEVSSNRPATRNPRSEPRNSQRVTRNANRAPRNLMFLCLTLIAILSIFIVPGLLLATTDQDQEAFKETILKLSALGDRSTGTDGNQAAAAYIQARFEQLGFETIGTQKFAVPAVQDQKSTLYIPARNLSISISSLLGNAVTPQTIPPSGIQAPLIYVGNGDLADLNGKAIEGAIVLMELDSGKNWLYVADLGARALIYVDRGKSSRILFEEKYELSPIQFPRLWVSFDRLQDLFPGFETSPAGRVAEDVHLASNKSWKNVISKNIYAIVPGTDPKLQEQSVMVEAFYDSTVWVAGLSPGADEACSAATLLNLARYLKDNPPRRTVILVATSGHAQTLAGMRELMWGLTTRSKIQREMKRDLKKLIKQTRNTINALKNATFTTADPEDPAAVENQILIKDALEERIKTVSDGISRRLMRLRMRENAAENQDPVSYTHLRAHET